MKFSTTELIFIAHALRVTSESAKKDAKDLRAIAERDAKRGDADAVIAVERLARNFDVVHANCEKLLVKLEKEGTI